MSNMSETSNIIIRCLGWTDGIFVLFLVILMGSVQNARCELTALSIIAKPASQGSGYYPPGNAVDGDIHSFSHTAVIDSHPWWQVDLETEHCLGRITVILRQGCCDLYRFTAAVARAGLSSNYADNQPCGLPATRAQSYTGATVVFMCDAPRMARYVTLDIDSTSPVVTEAILQLGEVRVDEYSTAKCGTNAGTTEALPVGNTASQGSEHSSYPPGNALDGKINSSTHTDTRTSCLFKLIYEGRSCVKNTRPLATILTRSLEPCVLQCKRNAMCWSLDFAPTTGHCRLYGEREEDLVPDPTELGCAVYAVVSCSVGTEGNCNGSV